MSVVKEFKDFAMRGNMIDMAVGIIIGGAFGKIIGSLVNDVIMPPIGVLLGGVDFSNLMMILKKAIGDSPEVTLRYGAFINTIVNFLIVAFCIFMIVKMMNNLKKKEVAAPAAPPAPSKQEVLLSEIRDLLKKS